MKRIFVFFVLLLASRSLRAQDLARGLAGDA